MAPRDGIKVLQTRLATRLQAAQAEGTAVTWLAVQAAGHRFLLPLEQSGEIVSAAQLQTIPHVQSWFCGVLNVRGHLHGVVDLAAFLAQDMGLQRLSPAAPDSAASTHVVTLHAALETHAAVQVDALAGLRGVDAFTSSTPAPPEAPAYWGALHHDASGQSWQEIQLRKLAQWPAFLHINA